MCDHTAAAPLLASGPLAGPGGAPLLVLGNSLGTTAGVWRAQVADLSRSFRVLCYELPGHGGSPAPPGPYTVAELGGGLLALLDAHGIRRVGYCGISLGGMIGLWLAAHAPDRVAALAVVCSSAWLPPAAGWRDRAVTVRAAGLAAISVQVVSRWFTPAFAAREPGVVSEFRAALEETTPEGYAGCCEAIAAMDQRADLSAITAPTLVIAGAADPATPPEHGAAIAAGVGGARLEVIPGAAHLPTVSDSGVVTRLLSEHLHAVAAGDPAWADGR